jgi:hypothetical protein
MGFLQYESILKLRINKCGLNGLNGKKMVLEVNEVLAKHEFNVQLISYVKDERGNLSTMTQVLTSIVSCEKLGLAHPFVGSCWGHAI